MFRVTSQAYNKASAAPESGLMSPEHYRVLRRKTTFHMSLIYLSPVIVLAAYFILQYDAVVSESEHLHLRAIAESQANTLELFLSERRVNLSNLIDDPAFPFPPTSGNLKRKLEKLHKSSDAFVDIGFFDSSGVHVAYAGPFPSLEKRSYRSEEWYSALMKQQSSFIITDIYLGFRQRPHFTIAVSRVTHEGLVVLRATLDPEKIYEYISSLESAQEVVTYIVNRQGNYQLVAKDIGKPLETSSLMPPQTPRQGAIRDRIEGISLTYGYSWLHTVDWSLIVQQSPSQGRGFFSGFKLRVIGVATAMIFVGFIVIVNRARKRVELQKDSDISRAQLSHAAKLASVGELAAGIAHEINNPISGIMVYLHTLARDLENDRLDRKQALTFLTDSKYELTRCSRIIKSLLDFSRQSHPMLAPVDLGSILNETFSILGHKVKLQDIEVVQHIDPGLPQIQADIDQLKQVFFNLILNAIQAMPKGGRLTIHAAQVDDKEGLTKSPESVRIDIKDTGCGIAEENIGKLFTPFFTTKEKGEGVGLGLAVAYGIIKRHGGDIRVMSSKGKGTTFSIFLGREEERKKEDDSRGAQ